MIHVISLLFACCAGVWYFVKQTALTFDEPEYWDWAEPAAGIAGALGAAHVSYPVVIYYHGPMGSIIYRSLTFAAFVTLASVMLSIACEERGWIRTPDGLAPPKARLLEGVTGVDELNGDALEKYMEGGHA